MPSWAWAIVVSAVGLVGTFILAIWKFGLSAGKLTFQMDILVKSLGALTEEFKIETRAFRGELQRTGKQMAVLETRLQHVEDRRLRMTPPFGMPVGGGEGGENP